MKKYVILFLMASVVMTGCARRPSEDNFYFGTYSEAESLYNRKQYERAIQKYQAYIDENPQGNLSAIASYYMGRSYMALGKKEEAKALFQKVAKEHPDLVWANFSQTQIKELEKTPETPAKK